MPEYRYTGVNITGKPIQGVIYSLDNKAVKSKLQQVVKTKGVRIDTIEKKQVFLYKVSKSSEAPIQGEQRAFSQEELRKALIKMGYKVYYVRRKLIDIKFKVPVKDLVLFVRICADLLKEKFSYDEILTLVRSDTENRRLRETISDIQKDLKSGSEGKTVYAKHEDVFGRFTAHMLSVASTSGNMAAIYDSTAKFLEREEEFKNNLRSVLLMPMVVFFALFSAVGFYIMYIFPKMTTMLAKHNIEIPPMTQATLNLSDFLASNWLVLSLAFTIPVVAFWQWSKTERGRYIIDRNLLRLPVLGPVLHKTSIEIFARVFNGLYSSSGENITAIRIAAESCRNAYIEKQVTSMVVPAMLREGKSFVECLSRANCFTLTAVRRLKAGEESGTLRETALQLANYYEKENKHKMSRLVDIINLTISIVATLMIVGLTLISSELGFVSPPSPLSK